MRKLIYNLPNFNRIVLAPRPESRWQHESTTNHMVHCGWLLCLSQADLKTLKLDVDTFGTKFDVVRPQNPSDIDQTTDADGCRMLMLIMFSFACASRIPCPDIPPYRR